MLNKLERRIIDISYKNGTSHIGSCLNCVNAIDAIYKVKNPRDKFVLSNGHAFLALAVVLEKYLGYDAEELVKQHGTHPNRDELHGIWVSTGSLGQGLPIAVGMAIADPTKNIFVMLSDGECAEGSVWEGLRIAGEKRLENLRVEVIANGLSGNGHVDIDLLDTRLQMFYPTLTVRTNLFKYPDWLQELNGHYVVMNEEMYKEITK